MAAADFYLKIDGIDGESEDSKHTKEIEVQSWSWGESNEDLLPAAVAAVPGKSPCRIFTSR